MTTSSVSFRITRHTEDLAQTIHALSQRLVQLEQRFAMLEVLLSQPQQEVPSADHLASLANVDQLLSDCRELLADQPLDGGAGLTAAAKAPVALQSLPADPTDGADPLEGLEEAA